MELWETFKPLIVGKEFGFSFVRQACNIFELLLQECGHLHRLSYVYAKRYVFNVKELLDLSVLPSLMVNGGCSWCGLTNIACRLRLTMSIAFWLSETLQI